MELKIGENVRRLRRDKNMTQEQLSELLNISSAAVSKWESSDTFPDITMIIPLARIFDVSVDYLMGYDEAKTEKDILDIISEYRTLQYNGQFKKAQELIFKARKDYPNDYRIMNIYMWHLAEGSADNNSEVLKSHYDELILICNCILNGCTEEQIRLEALTMKAKLFHATGNTSTALELLQSFPTWYQSYGQNAEQLFDKSTPEFRYWVRKNLYELADFASDKAVKEIFFDDTLTLKEKVEKIESLGNMISKLYDESGETLFAIILKSFWGRLANDLTFRGGEEKDIIRIRDKQLSAVKAISESCEEDIVLTDVFEKTQNTDNLLKWTVNYYKDNKNKQHTKLRENPEYIAILEKYNL